MKNTRIMRVPNDFYDTIKGISSRDRRPMAEILSESAPIITKSDLLTRLWYGETYRRRKK